MSTLCKLVEQIVLCARFAGRNSTGKYFAHFFGAGWICFKFVVRKMDFVRRERECQEKEMLSERHENEKPTSRQKLFGDRRFQRTTILIERGFKNFKGYKKNGAKRKPCQENRIYREQNVKRRRSLKRCQEKEASTESGRKDKRKLHQAKVATSDTKHVKDKKFRKITESMAVPGGQESFFYVFLFLSLPFETSAQFAQALLLVYFLDATGG